MVSNLEIVVLTGVSAGDVFRFPLESNGVVRIGRDPQSEMVLDGGLVSRKHAEIHARNGGFVIIDCGSTHGTVHMGFQLKAGPDGARELSPGDEFRIGDTKFRVDFEAPKVAAPSAGEAAVVAPGKTKNKKLYLLGGAGLAALLLALYFLLPGSGPGGVKQDDSPMPLPQFRVVGFLNAGTTPDLSDRKHPIKAVFSLPPSDVLVEYEYRGEANIEVLLDTQVIDRVAPNIEGWQQRQLIIRDPLMGKPRNCIIRNADYKQGKPLKKWAVRNIRTTPLSRALNSDLSLALDQTIGLSLSSEKSTSGASQLIRGLQRTVLEAVIESGSDGVGYPIDLESQPPSAEDLQEELQQFKKERIDNPGPATAEHELGRLVQLSAEYDAELWRRVKSRLNAVRLAAKMKDYITAHDDLIAIKQMFVDESDYRWEIADKLFNDKSIVPPKVKARPDKFRKKKLESRSL